MKLVSMVYQTVPIKDLDDWLSWENAEEESEGGMLTPDEIRHLNSDFNYKNYWQFFDRMEEEKEELGERGKSLEETLDFQNKLYHMFKNVKVDPEFYENYEQWLEEEVWGYYD